MCLDRTFLRLFLGFEKIVLCYNADVITVKATNMSVKEKLLHLLPICPPQNNWEDRSNCLFWTAEQELDILHLDLKSLEYDDHQNFLLGSIRGLWVISINTEQSLLPIVNNLFSDGFNQSVITH